VTTGVAPIITLRGERPDSPFNLGGISDMNISGRTSSIDDRNITASPIGADIGEVSFALFDDIDDYNGVDLNLSIFNHEITSANEGEYIDQTIVINSRVSLRKLDRPSGNILTCPICRCWEFYYYYGIATLSPFQEQYLRLLGGHFEKV